MYRRLTAATLSALLLGLCAVAQAQNSTPIPAQESENPIGAPASSDNYRSHITNIAPSFPGLDIEMVGFTDRLMLTNHTDETVTVYGYQGEPYARVTADGTVQVNVRSPAYYLNQSFYGDVYVPSSASPTARADWTVIGRSGQLEWRDHRIHWMSPALPAQVKDTGKRTKIFDWRVPIKVGATPGDVDGQLFWVPEGNTRTPLAAIVAPAVVVVALAGLAFVFVARRRRRGPPGAKPAASTVAGANSPGGPDRPVRDAR